jgi:filamentous hemagglutinin family protein
MKKRSGKQFGAKRVHGRRHVTATPKRGAAADAARIGALLLTGSFAIAQVPVYAAGALPVPCPGSGASCVGGTGKALGWDQLHTGSTITTGKAGMVISQLGNAGIFNWASFNISPGYTVQFIQPSNSSVALNRIFDPNVTTIAGNLIANGQIYLINPNGILFGSGANVNVAGLIASTSNITDARITSGLLAANTNVLNPDYSDPVFTNNASVLGASVADSPVASANANPAIVVQSGASLYAAGKNTQGTVVSAGRIFLFAPTVENGGTLKVDGGGQVILAAGSDVYLGSSSEPSLRGLLVEVDGSTAAGVTVDASGTISVPHGNITLMGLAVNQAGTLSATSALDANGSISLIARQADPTSTANVTDRGVLMPIGQTGTVNVASGSNTTVTLDPSDTATAPLDDPTAAALVSTINIEGLNVNIGGNGAPRSTLIQAHGGDVTVTARQGSSVFDGSQTYAVGDASVLGTDSAASTINVGSDALIDVSGLQNVPVNGASEFVYISRLTSLNLADAPLQRNGFLLGQGVYINLADAPSWINVSNLQAAISSTQAQRNTVGGTVALNAEGSVNLAKGSVINVSGGSTYLTPAVGRTSELITANGADVNISNASANTQYVGFADQGSYTDSDSREGINTTVSWQTPVFTTVGGYTQGANAGTVQIYAPMATLSGSLLGNTISSSQQRSSLPEGGLLRIGSQNASDLDSEAAIQRGNILLASSAALLQQGLSADLAAATSGSGPSPVIALNTTTLSQEGFTRLDLTSDGAVEVAPGSPLNLGPGGSFTARANAIAIDSTITAPGGSVCLSERPVTNLPDGSSGLLQRDALSFIPETSPLRGSVVFAAGTSINVAGLWTNDLLGADNGTTPDTPLVLDGGSIAISARTVDVSGASFDVSSGAWLTDKGSFSGGSGGKLSLTAKYSSLTLINPVTNEPWRHRRCN